MEKIIKQNFPKYRWSPEKYIKLVEKTRDLILREYMDAEIEYILKNVQNPNLKTFIDVGAGYGRVISQLSKIGKNVIAVEINKKMLKELQKSAERLKNVTVIKGDANYLTKLLKKYDKMIEKPVLLSLQNTLGTAIGDPYKILLEMKQIAVAKKGEIILSLFCQESLKSWGVKMYASLKSMVGKIDNEKTDFNKGVFVSETGYRSKWWTTKERINFKNRLKGEISILSRLPYFCIIHSRYNSKN